MSYLQRGRYIIAISVFLMVATTGVLRAQTLGDTLVKAYNHSGILDQNRALLRAADEDVGIVISGLRPILSWTSQLERSFGKSKSFGTVRDSGSTNFTIAISASLLAYDFGRTALSAESAKEIVLSTRKLLIGAEQQILFRATQAHINYIRGIQIVSLRQNNLRLLQEQLRATSDRFEVGDVTSTDVAQAEARVAGARGGLSLAQGDLIQAGEEYRAATGHKPGALRPPSRLPTLPGNVEAATSIALRGHPDLQKAQHDVAAAELNIQVTKAAMKPTLNVFADLSVSDGVGDSDYIRGGSLGVQATGPIYNGGRLTAEVRRATAQRDAQLGVLHQVKHQIIQNIGNSYAILRAAQASRTANQEAVRAATVAFRGVREEALLGTRTTLDVLDAEQELLNTKTDLISADSDVQIAAFSVLASLGQLTVKDLKLNVPTYDPVAYYNLVKDAPIAKSKQGRQLDKVLKSLGKN